MQFPINIKQKLSNRLACILRPPNRIFPCNNKRPVSSAGERLSHSSETPRTTHHEKCRPKQTETKWKEKKNTKHESLSASVFGAPALKATRFRTAPNRLPFFFSLSHKGRTKAAFSRGSRAARTCLSPLHFRRRKPREHKHGGKKILAAREFFPGMGLRRARKERDHGRPAPSPDFRPFDPSLARGFCFAHSRALASSRGKMKGPKHTKPPPGHRCTWLWERGRHDTPASARFDSAASRQIAREAGAGDGLMEKTERERERVR